MRPPGVVIALALALLLPTAVEASPSAAEARGPGAAAQAEPGDLLPDMRLQRLYGLTIRTTKDGRKRLRFGTRAFNIGVGPMEVRGSQPVNDEMTVFHQWIADDQGAEGRLVAPSGGGMFWSGDGHNHWHIEQFINVELFKRGELDSTLFIRKIGFCLLDLIRSENPPPGAPPKAVYPYNACGTSAAPPPDGVKMGISVGYADDYQPLIANQWIDITSLPKGIYRLCAKVNPLGHWLESSTDNNFFWHDILVNPARSVLSIQQSGRTPCGTYR
jgi:hypothetical protein